MRLLRPAADRGHATTSWLDSRHTFSFGHYYDPRWMGFGALRVINEDRVAPGAGFPEHGHANMEILSYVLDGALAHRDSAGGEGVVRAGEWQWMSAGRGVEHSEYNASDTAPVHFLQIWIQPDRVNTPPAHALHRPGGGAAREGWALVASPEGAEGSLALRQQAWLRRARLLAGAEMSFAAVAGRRYWLHLARGGVRVDGQRLDAGSAIGIADEAAPLRIAADAADSELLLFDLPP